MTEEKQIEMGLLMVDHANRKCEVESRPHPTDRWEECKNPIWVFESCEYRRKRKPLERWALLNKKGEVYSTYRSRSTARAYRRKGFKVVKMKEVEE